MAAANNNGNSEFVKLEQRLILLDWFNAQLGYDSNKDLMADIKDVEEGFDGAGRSYIFHRLESRGRKVLFKVTDLARYDENIRAHLQRINNKRPEPITFRYFQYLAVLYSEIFLDNYFNRRRIFLRTLNNFVDDRNSRKTSAEVHDIPFTEKDLNKLAFWMATGSGKTLIMHINYLQFLHYNSTPLDNILLITPNEGLSEQHIKEMNDSDISSVRFDFNESGLDFSGKNKVRVIEITKLVEEKRGGGVSVPVEAFEGNNLIFVDEGHKGSQGETWRKYRDALGETGFTFEYSATFGQALTASKNDVLTAEYGKAIVFDYSYRYFHEDGYGKDFRILNLKQETTEDKTEVLLLGNMLSFYEQQLLFKKQAAELKPYHLEKPLWVFVGKSVNAVFTEKKKKRSDVLNIARFIHHFLENKNDWAVKALHDLIEDEYSGIQTPFGDDIFKNKFKYLRDIEQDARTLYQNILRNVLHAPSSGGLHLCDMQGHSGELGLKASSSDKYFGLIYIGDTGEFKKLVEADDADITLEDDSLADSLFDDINKPDTSINMLIGAKKFIEGWNSWRVSSMGLLNVGQSEGSEIIQLFGRGVRLRGKNFSLKRSSAISGNHPEHIELLETLNIFAVRANYMTHFRDYLEKEGVETEEGVELPLAIRPNKKFLSEGLVIPRVPDHRNFTDEKLMVVEADRESRVDLDLSLKIVALESGERGITAIDASSGIEQRHISKEYLDLIDWEKVYLDILEYKNKKCYSNLVILPDVLKEILTTTEPDRLYTLIAEQSLIQPETFSEVELLQDAVLSILQKYIDKFYRINRERWDSANMAYQQLDENDPNFQDYVVVVNKSEEKLIAAVDKLIKEANEIYKQDTEQLPGIHFDRHLYQPLLIEKGSKVKSRPPGLTISEHRFVEDLRTYCLAEKDKSLADREIFLLRNLSRGKGVGFFDGRGFYPDFILWIKSASQQKIVFVEPHGMIHAGLYENDEKAQLHKQLPDLAKAIEERSSFRNISLDSFIISATEFKDLKGIYANGTWDKKDFCEAHILFPERSDDFDYIAHILNGG